MLQNISDSFNGWWFGKSYEQRQKITKWTMLGVLFLGYVISAYWLENRNQDSQSETIEQTETEVVILDSPQKILEQDIITTANLEVEKATETALGNFKNQVAALNPLSDSNRMGTLDNPKPVVNLQVDTRFPTPPSEIDGDFGFDDSGQEISSESVTEEEEWLKVGGLRNSGATESEYKLMLSDPLSQSTSTEVRKVTLPVGFMKARLLVGINARSGEFGMNNPQQLVFLVQAPAQLPNKIKMDLAGCFAVTNAFGDMSSGRIEAPPVSLTCLTHKGKFIAEAKALKGFVQDQDGKRGLDARVVSRARHLLASSLFARTVEAFGSLGVAQGMVTSNSPLGSVSSVSNDKLPQTALAKGLEGGAGDLSKYLLDLAKQTHPVMEHGAGKAVLLWLAETTELEIKEMKQ